MPRSTRWFFVIPLVVAAGPAPAQERKGEPVPMMETTQSLNPERLRRLAGRYQAGDTVLDLYERSGRLFVLPQRGGYLAELRASGDGLILDDRRSASPKVAVDGEQLRIGDDVYERIPVAQPAPAPARWLGVIGEYGNEHNRFVILEKDGRLHALIDWVYLYPLEEESESACRFPEFGVYRRQRLVFTRNSAGRASALEVAGIAFERRRIDGEDGRTFQIRPERPVDELRRAAAVATPPKPQGELNTPDYVDLTTLDPTIKLDIRYATTNNFLGTPVYTSARAFLQRPAAEAVVRAHRELAKQGYGLLIHDGFRLWSITKVFWDATPAKHHLFVADPALGSRHNRGCAVDLTLFDRATGQPIPMVGGYDEFSDRSYPDYLGGTSLQRWHRDLLRRAMEDQGFTVYEAEWWHFDFREWKKYPTSNYTFEEIDAMIESGRMGKAS